MATTFLVDAAPFHPVLEIEDQTLTDPKKLRIKKVVVPPEHFGGRLAIYADDNGKPGTVLARKKVLPKYAGNVHLDNLYGDFLENGSLQEWLPGKPGTFRRSVKGDDTLHVLPYKDDPADTQFTSTEGGSEDQPVLDAGGSPTR